MGNNFSAEFAKISEVLETSFSKEDVKAVDNKQQQYKQDVLKALTPDKNAPILQDNYNPNNKFCENYKTQETCPNNRGCTWVDQPDVSGCKGMSTYKFDNYIANSLENLASTNLILAREFCSKNPLYTEATYIPDEMEYNGVSVAGKINTDRGGDNIVSEGMYPQNYNECCVACKQSDLNDPGSCNGWQFSNNQCLLFDMEPIPGNNIREARGTNSVVGWSKPKELQNELSAYDLTLNAPPTFNELNWLSKYIYTLFSSIDTSAKNRTLSQANQPVVKIYNNIVDIETQLQKKINNYTEDYKTILNNSNSISEAQYNNLQAQYASILKLLETLKYEFPKLAALSSGFQQKINVTREKLHQIEIILDKEITEFKKSREIWDRSSAIKEFRELQTKTSSFKIFIIIIVFILLFVRVVLIYFKSKTNRFDTLLVILGCGAILFESWGYVLKLTSKARLYIRHTWRYLSKTVFNTNI